MKRLIISGGILLSIILFQNCKDNSLSDPCSDVFCFNDGYCVSGACSCPEGYSGVDCATQITPDKMYIQDIRVTKFPATKNNGGGWDTDSGPDIFPVISVGIDDLWIGSQEDGFYLDATPGSVYDWTATPNILIANPRDEYNITLYDYDYEFGFEWIGGVNFTPYWHPNNKFPATIKLDGDYPVNFELDVLYSW